MESPEKKSLTLEPLLENHIDLIWRENFGNVADFFVDFKSWSEAEAWVKEAILKHQSGKKLEFLAFDSELFVGMVSPQFLDTDTVDIGIWVAVDMQGKGYGHKILTTLFDWLRSKKVKKVFYDADSHNTASINLATSLGFEIESQDAKSVNFVKYL